jgi:hypothetical protein
VYKYYNAPINVLGADPTQLHMQYSRWHVVKGVADEIFRALRAGYAPVYLHVFSRRAESLSDTRVHVRPHKLNSLFSVSTFSIFHAGGRSLFIIHCSVSSNSYATPLIEWVWPDDHRVMLRLKVTRAGVNEPFLLR